MCYIFFWYLIVLLSDLDCPKVKVLYNVCFPKIVLFSSDEIILKYWIDAQFEFIIYIAFSLSKLDYLYKHKYKNCKPWKNKKLPKLFVIICTAINSQEIA